MTSRLELHEKLVDILGARNVYFQPPESIKLTYPCIIYNVDNEDVEYASDRIYTEKKEYSIMIIDKNPESLIPHKLRDSFNYCSFSSIYQKDNLYHYVYSLYY